MIPRISGSGISTAPSPARTASACSAAAAACRRRGRRGRRRIGVNAYLWRATLDTIAFMPLASADPFGGVIITDWYSPPERPTSGSRSTSTSSTAQLRADGVRVAVFRQASTAGGGWVDAAVDPTPRDGAGERDPDARARAAHRASSSAVATVTAAGAFLTRCVRAGQLHVALQLPRSRAAVAAAWADAACFARGRATRRARNTTCWRCSPIPSGRIHMGHVRNYTMGDVVARFKRAGLQRAASDGLGRVRPAGRERGAREAASIPRDLDLREHRRDARPAASAWACRSTGRANSPPAIPNITSTQQKLFLDFLHGRPGLSQGSWVNWDPVDSTVLANEQVIDGRGWRSGAPVEKRKLAQWFFKITDYRRRTAGGAGRRWTAGRTRSG